MSVDWQDTRLQEKADRVQRTIWALRRLVECAEYQTAISRLDCCALDDMLDDPDLQAELSGIIAELTEYGT